MLKILVCCGGGFSSSYITEKMKKEIVEKNLQDEVSMDFYPFGIAKERFDEFDIVVCCPHLFMSINKLLKESQPDIPLYLLPPKMYGTMAFEEVYQDAKDIVELFKKTKTNPCHFPNEDNVMKITRGMAYRHVHPNYKI